MTNEQAKNIIESCDGIMWNRLTDAENEALSMAIEALSCSAFPNRSDLISRQDTIDEIEERKNANGYRNVAVISELNRLEGYIMRLPSVQPERKGKWIKKMKVTESETCTFYTPEWYCKNCGKKYDPCFANDFVNYCYVCGDDMRGESNG